MTDRNDQTGDAPSREGAMARIIETYERYETSGYDRRWRDPSAGMTLAQQEVDRWWAEAVGPAAEVVDLGCGSGRVARALDSQGHRPRRYVGVDLIPSRLAEAARDLPWAEFVETSADRVPVPNESIEVVTASTLLSSVIEDSMRRAIAGEVQRILKPGGRLVVYDIRLPSPGNPNVRPVTRRGLSLLFPGWPLTSRTLTVLPPLARSRVAGGRRRYAALEAIPILRSHVAAVLVKA